MARPAPRFTSAPYDDNQSVPIPTARAPPVRSATRGGNASGTLRRAKTLTRPERGVAPPPLINPPSPLLPAAGLPSSQRPESKHPADHFKWDAWRIFSHIVTFWAPPILLSSIGGIKDRPTRQAWREKISLCFIALLMGAFVGFATMGLDRVLCPASDNGSSNPSRFIGLNTTSAQTVGLMGWQYNISQSLIGAVNFYSLYTQLPGQDTTILFQRPASSFTACAGLNFNAARDEPCSATSQCNLGPPTKATTDSLGIYNTTLLVGYDWDQVSRLNDYLVIDGAVLNFHAYMLAHPNAIPGDNVDRAIRTVLRSQSAEGGKDATRLFYNRNELKAAIPCLVQKYYAGNIDKITPGCFISQLFLYVSLLVIMGLVLARFAMACVFNWFMSARLVAPPKNLSRTVISPAVLPEGANIAVDSKNGTAPWARGKKGKVIKPSKSASSVALTDASSTTAASGPLISMSQIGAELFTVALITCYSEGEDSIRTTVDSIATTTYSDSRKLLFIVADGMITGEGEKRSTPDICVGLLEADPRFGNPMPMSYIAVGTGAKKENRAMVYAGHYVSKGHRTPTVIIVKCGTEKEAATDKKPGNRGKRDSQLILMNFFSRVTYNDRMTPLDFDLFRKIQVLMGVTPDFFEACLMVDADTKVYPDSLTQLVNCLHHDNLIMGVCGETRIANKRDSWVTAIQVYEYFISHHLAKAFESVFGGVTCLPGCFSMYRLKARKVTDDDWVPLITKPEIVKEYSQSEVYTLHQKNLLLLGEDRFLTTILLRTFPNRKMMFCPQARCRTVAPDTFAVLLSQRRRWINSTIHNLMELVRVRNLCGTFCFSMQFVVFMDLLGTTVLPVAISLTYALVVSMALDPPDTFEKAIPLMMLLAVIGLPAVLILITTRKVVYVFWMMIYLVALPIWNFVLPVYAFWHFDDFSWGETRRVEGEGATKAHDDHGGAVIDGTNVPLRRWEDWERSRLRKLRREERRRRELERAYPGGYPADRSVYLRSEYFEGSDTMSMVSSDDDQWGQQIGGYNENGPQYPPPPTALMPSDPNAFGGGQTLGSAEMEAMLEQGWDDRPSVPSSPRQGYALSDAPPPTSRFNAYAPLARTPSPNTAPPPGEHVMSPISPNMPTNGTSSAVGGEWKTHAKKRSVGREADRGSDGWGPLGPLDPAHGPKRF